MHQQNAYKFETDYTEKNKLWPLLLFLKKKDLFCGQIYCINFYLSSLTIFNLLALQEYFKW